MNNLSKITVILITYNRYEYLERALNYYLMYPIRIIVADNSQEKNIKNSLKKLLKSENVDWNKYDPSINVIEKINYSLQK